jgi:periplasmic protein TonB
MSVQRTLAAVPNEICAPQGGAPQIVVPTLTFAEAVLELLRLQHNTNAPVDLDAFLKRLVSDTHMLLRASGSAIGLRDGQMYRWRARWGEPGPLIGAHIYTGSGISGQCLVSGEMQSCQDTWNDARVDAELCRQLGLRSMVVAPIKRATRIDGILEAWSGDPLAFDGRSLDILEELADLTAFAREKSLRLPPGVVFSLPSASPKDAASVSNVLPPREQRLFGQVSLRRVKEEFVEAATGLLSGRMAQLAPFFVRVRVRGLVFAGFLAIVTWAVWYGWGSGARSTPVRTATHPLQAHTNTLPPTVADIQGTALFSPQPSPPARRVIQHTQPETSGPGSSMESTRPKPLIVVPAPPPSVPSVIEDVPPPPVVPAGASGGLNKGATQLSGFLFSSAPATPAYPMSSGLTGGNLRVSPAPIYPSLAKSAGIEGTVVLQAVVDEQGHVQDLKVKDGPPALTEAAIEAVRQWQFEPYVLDDHPVRMSKEIKVQFKLK